jgi:flagellar basal-body rod protein FlgG
LVRGLYTAASGSLVAQSAVDTIANHLANVHTAGFKRTLLQVQSQPQRDIYRIQTDPGQTAGAPGVSAMQLVGQLGSGAQVYDTPADFQQGPIAATGNDLDVALSGPGFFTLRDGNNATSYSRDGSFERDAQGFLTAQNGDRVLGTNNAPIQLPATGKLAIDRAGAVSVDGQQVAQLNVVEFQNTAALRPQGSERYVDTGASTPRAATRTSTLQGSIEKSNADVVSSMVDLITNERWFQANQQVMQSEDTLTGQAVQTVGRSNAN